MGKIVEINQNDLKMVFDTLLNDEVKTNIFVNAFKEGAEVLKQATIDTLRRKPVNSSNMERGIGVGVDKGYRTVWVSIMKHSLNHLFELGTNERYRKITDKNVQYSRKNHIYKKDRATNTENGYTGKIEPLYFFREAREASTDAVMEAIQRAFDTEMKNILP